MFFINRLKSTLQSHLNCLISNPGGVQMQNDKNCVAVQILTVLTVYKNGGNI